MDDTETLRKKALAAIANVVFDVSLTKDKCIENAEKLIAEGRVMLKALKDYNAPSNPPNRRM